MFGVIGDMHGCFNTLANLLDEVYTRFGTIPLLATGDLVDRGNFSAQTVELVIANNIKPVLGNHDVMFWNYYKNPEHPLSLRWNLNGSEATKNSYVQHQELLEGHLDFIQALPWFIRHENILITHAGISKRFYQSFMAGRNLSDENLQKIFDETLDEENGILWNREKLIRMDKIQIVGHTKQKSVAFDTESNSYYIDTGAYTGNSLSAVIFEREQLVEIISIPTNPEDIIS